MEHCIHFYYGDGKGKSTAAAGAALRMVGNGGRVLYVPFLKPAESGELRLFVAMKGITLLPCPNTEKFSFCMTEQEQADCRLRQEQRLAEADRLWQREPFDMVVLDEGATACELHMLSEAALCEAAARWNESSEVLITGHSRLETLAQQADYVTEMKKEKHPFERGLAARDGIEK